jgi:non-canonical poly(A) RNA polymerase PAPD5/7
LTVITRAKVPIIKFTDKQTGIRVDISVENDTGLIALQTFAQWKEKYPAMSIIVVLIKQMLAMRNLNEVFHGGLGGFSIICLVVSVMQHMPEIQSENMDPSLHYGELLLNFLDLYGNKFNLQSTGIVVEPPGYFDKIRNPHKKQNMNGLTIVDPNKPDNDISGGSRKIATVFKCFRTAYSEIQRRLAEIYSGENVEDSILGCVLAGNYTSFIKQRNRLSLLHQGRPISPIPVVELDESDEVEEVDAPQPKPHKNAGKPKPLRGGRRGAGGKAPAKNSAAPSHPPAQAPMPQRPQPNQNKHPVPQRPPPNGAYEARPKRFVDLYIDPESSLVTNLYRELQAALDMQQTSPAQPD